ASRLRRARKRAASSALGPTATMRVPVTATAPSFRMRRRRSSVSTCPCRINRSQVSGVREVSLTSVSSSPGAALAVPGTLSLVLAGAQRLLLHAHRGRALEVLGVQLDEARHLVGRQLFAAVGDDLLWAHRHARLQ